MKNPASALLISFFIMAILILVGLSVSGIIFRDIAVVRTVINGLQASYAAEGMSEVGLNFLKKNLPGYVLFDYNLSLANNTVGTLNIVARGENFPCDEQGSEDSDWRNLSLNESITIPLFASDKKVTENFTDFSVEYYLPDNPSPQGNVLRWKILGLKDDKTEAISDYLEGSGSSKFFASNSTAKFYEYVNGSHYVFNPAYPIAQFLGDHEFNYLILSNVVQLVGTANIGSVQDSSDADENTINFKMTSAQNPVCEYVQINTDSNFSDVRKSLKAIVKEGENLPVFDFALYESDPDKNSAANAGAKIGIQFSPVSINN